MKFYAIDASSNVKEYLKLGNDIDRIRKACSLSEFQHLDRNVCYSELDEESGNLCQDFIYDRGIPLVSEKVKDFFDEYGIDYLFYKKIILKKTTVGIEEPYWLALPPRIDCLNFEESEIDTFLNSADEIVINENKIGRYEIFKLGKVTNLEIVVTENLAKKLKEKKFVGMHIYSLS